MKIVGICLVCDKTVASQSVRLLRDVGWVIEPPEDGSAALAPSGEVVEITVHGTCPRCGESKRARPVPATPRAKENYIWCRTGCGEGVTSSLEAARQAGWTEIAADLSNMNTALSAYSGLCPAHHTAQHAAHVPREASAIPPPPPPPPPQTDGCIDMETGRFRAVCDKMDTIAEQQKTRAEEIADAVVTLAASVAELAGYVSKALERQLERGEMMLERGEMVGRLADTVSRVSTRVTTLENSKPGSPPDSSPDWRGCIFVAIDEFRDELKSVHNGLVCLEDASDPGLSKRVAGISVKVDNAEQMLRTVTDVVQAHTKSLERLYAKKTTHAAELTVGLAKAVLSQAATDRNIETLAHRVNAIETALGDYGGKHGSGDPPGTACSPVFAQLNSAFKALGRLEVFASRIDGQARAIAALKKRLDKLFVPAGATGRKEPTDGTVPDPQT